MKIGEIERGIPAPQKRRGRTPKYPFATLSVGESRLIEGGDFRMIKWAAYRFGKRWSRELVVEESPDGVRVWRTS